MGNIVAFEELACEGIADPPYKQVRVEGLILLAEQTVESVTGRLFYKRDNLTLYASGNAKELLTIEHPALAITAIEEDGTVLDAAEYEIVKDFVGEKSLFSPKLRRLNGGVWARGERNIKITGSFGHVYVTGTAPNLKYRAPEVIRRTIMRMVVHNLSSLSTQVASTGRGEIIREKLNGAEFQYAEGTSSSGGWTGDAEITQTLNRYRRLNMAAV